MNPYGDTSPAQDSPSDSHDDSHNASLSPPAPVIQTGHSSVTVYPTSTDQDRSQNTAPSPSSTSDPDVDLRTRPQSSLVSVLSPAPIPNPYPGPALSTPLSRQVSIIIPSPDLRPSRLPSQCSEESCPDLECSICFSQFNNVFRCPKMLQCRHTFCLECLARINVKSVEPNAIQCPLCRSFTPLPALGLPRLATNSDMMSYLPASMQRVYSIRFLRNKGKLQVKSHPDRYDVNTTPAILFPSTLVLNGRNTFTVENCKLSRPKVNYRTCNLLTVKDNQKNVSYPDPVVGASRSFIHRISELSSLEGETVRQEKLKKMRKPKKPPS